MGTKSKVMEAIKTVQIVVTPRTYWPPTKLESIKSKVSGNIPSAPFSTGVSRNVGPHYKINKAKPAASTSFNDLPIDVIVKIFTYFSEQELSSILARVCRKWRKASKDSSLWKCLEFQGNRVKATTICRMLRFAPYLLTINLISVPDIITVIRQICRCNNKLKNVTIKDCTDIDKDERIPESVIRNLILSCKNLRSLNLEGTQFFASKFCEDLVQLTYLRSLNLGTNQYIRVKDLVRLSLNCRVLEELKIAHRRACDGDAALSDEDASFIFVMLKDSLQSLAFDMRGLGAMTYQAIFQCSKLNQLCLNNALNLSSDLFRSVADYLPAITTLEIGNAGQLSTEDFCYLFTSKRHVMSNLTSLKLCGCWRLGDDGLKIIVDTCGDKLEILSIRSCKSLTSQSVEYVILKCHQLCFLDIAHIVKLNALSLSQILTHLPCLQMLVVDTDVKKEMWLHLLKSKIPHLKIKRSYSEYYKKEATFC